MYIHLSSFVIEKSYSYYKFNQQMWFVQNIIRVIIGILQILLLLPLYRLYKITVINHKKKKKKSKIYLLYCLSGINCIFVTLVCKFFCNKAYSSISIFHIINIFELLFHNWWHINCKDYVIKFKNSRTIKNHNFYNNFSCDRLWVIKKKLWVHVKIANNQSQCHIGWF